MVGRPCEHAVTGVGGAAGGEGWMGRDVQAGHAPVVGLTGAEADARARRGEANSAVAGVSRSYAGILRTNVFSFYNTILFVIGAALLALGRYSDALVSVGLGLVNALIRPVQEIRAKRKLDRLQLLDRAPVPVVRDGAEVEVAPEEIVRGDVLRVRPATRSWSTGRCSPAAGWRSTSPCSPASPTRSARSPATSCGRAASACRRAATSRPRRRRGQLRRPAHRRGPPGPPTRPRCSGASSSSSGWSWRWSC